MLRGVRGAAVTAFDSPDGRALYRAVCASPDDDLPRLVLADFLEESGGAADRDRAAFVRAQCEMAGTPYMAARWRQLARAVAPLWRAHRAAWEAEVDRPAGSALRFERGFAADLTARPGEFARDGEAVQASAPVTGLAVGPVVWGGAYLAGFVARPPVVRLRRLGLGAVTLTGEDFAALAAAGHLTGLRALTVPYFPRPRDAGPDVTAAVRGLPGLTDLIAVTAYPDPADAMLAALAGEPACRRLTRLGLGRACVEAAGLDAVTGSAAFAGLLRLDLNGYWSVVNPAPRLATTRTLAALEVLDLSGHHLSDADVFALGRAAFAPTLRVLVARHCGLAKADAKRFAGVFPNGEVVL